MDLPINLAAVLAAALAAFVLGFLWHGPLFGKLWMRLMGFTTYHLASLLVMAVVLALWR